MKTIVEQTTLPRIPSQLIRIALEDMKKFTSYHYNQIHMSEWCHQGNVEKNEPCFACAAGSVMLERLLPKDFELSTDEALHPEFFPKNSAQLYAINQLRLGEVKRGLACLGIDLPYGAPENVYMIPYALNADSFYRDMENLAKLLESHGL